jgi:DNA-binding CsgD family transcriptional regulator
VTLDAIGGFLERAAASNCLEVNATFAQCREAATSASRHHSGARRYASALASQFSLAQSQDRVDCYARLDRRRGSLYSRRRATDEGAFRGSAHHLNVRAACLAARLMKVIATMRRFGLSEREQERVWELWGQGTSLRAVARKLGARPEYVRRYVTSTGGVRPAPRRRAKRCLSEREREEVSRGVARGESCRAIAARIGRSHHPLPSRMRHAIYRAHMRIQPRLGVTAFAVVIDKANATSKFGGRRVSSDIAWEYLLQRLERRATKEGTEVLLVHDEGEALTIRKRARKSRRAGTAGSAFGTGMLSVPFLRLLDDPVPRTSHQSYFLQLADFNAYAAFRRLYPPPLRTVQIVTQSSGMSSEPRVSGQCVSSALARSPSFRDRLREARVAVTAPRQLRSEQTALTLCQFADPFGLADLVARQKPAARRAPPMSLGGQQRRHRPAAGLWRTSENHLCGRHVSGADPPLELCTRAPNLVRPPERQEPIGLL